MSTQLWFVVLYFVVVTAIGLAASRLAKSSDDFLVAGRGMGVLVASAAIAGEWIGGTSTIGTAEGGYLYGISAAWFSVANAIGTVVLAFTLARLYRRSSSFTVTGFMEEYLGSQVRVVSSIVLTFVMIAVGSVQIVAGSTLVNSLTGLAPHVGMVITGGVLLAYTLAGGLWAIGVTNLVHVFVMYFGVILGLVMIASGSGGMAALELHLPAEPFFSLWGAGPSKVAAWIVASVLAALVAQAAVQPIMGARDEKTAQRASLLAVLYVAPMGVMTALLGMFARIKYPDIAARMALPTLLTSLPDWAGGVVLAGILAAILSTVAPCILAAGTLLSKDVYQRFLNPEVSEAKLYRVSRLLTLGSGLMALVWAMYSTVILDQIYFAYTLRATIAVLLLFGVFWRRANRRGAVWALGASSVAAAGWEIAKYAGGRYPWGIHPMYVAMVLTVAIMLITGSTSTTERRSAAR